MKAYEWRGKDVWMCEDGEWTYICQAQNPLLGIEITEALNGFELTKLIRRRNDDRYARYKFHNEQFPPKKKVDW
jgi:hypothetical protein